MAIEYLSCGNIMSDRVEDEHGNFSEWNMGGPAFYALSGMRIWTPDVKLVCSTGADYADTYGKWMDDNGVSRESVRVEMEQHTRFSLKYLETGAFMPTPHFSMEHLGYLKTHADDIDRAAQGYPIKGMYMAHCADKIVWQNLAQVKAKHGFKIMWEVEYSSVNGQREGLTPSQALDKIRNGLEVADAWSLNSNEAADLFGKDKFDDEGIINELQKLPIDFTFYRVGDRGSFAVTRTNAYFCPVLEPFGPSVDPTGCGNCSTGSAAYALFSGEHPAMVAAMGNVAGGFNAAQRGPYRLYTPEKMALARQLAEKLFADMRTTQNF